TDDGGASSRDRLLFRHAEPAPHHGESSADERAQREPAAPPRLRAGGLRARLPADRRTLAGPRADRADEPELAQQPGAPLTLLPRPLDLELDLLLVPEPLVLDAERRARRHVDSLAGNLDIETLARLDRVCEPPELGRKLRVRIHLPDVTICHVMILPNRKTCI